MRNCNRERGNENKAFGQNTFGGKWEMPAAAPAAVQLATVVGGGVDEKLNKIWEITKAGRKKERERERERDSR